MKPEAVAKNAQPLRASAEVPKQHVSRFIQLRGENVDPPKSGWTRFIKLL
jgi:hypothetical protein